MDEKIKLQWEDLRNWISDQFNFGVIRDEYVNIYPHTILKSLGCVYDLATNNSSKDIACFDIQTVSLKGIFSDILDWLQSNYQLDISDIIDRAILPYIDPFSFEKPSSNPKTIRDALVACYEIIGIILILYLENNKEIDRDRLIFLPIEQECTLDYFVDRYVNKTMLHPETIEEFDNDNNAKRNHYTSLDQFSQHKEDIEMLQTDSDIYIVMAKKIPTTKRKLVPIIYLWVNLRILLYTH